jgi:hypothetical protein
MRELLIRYLLGELDHDERQQLQARLKASPELQRELAHLRACFAENGNADLFADEPPGQLAERTTERVAGCSDDDDSYERLSRRAAAIAATTEPPSGILGWSLADLTVAGGVMLAVSMLIFPALRDSRDGTRRTYCQNHQMQLGQLFAAFADDHENYFPKIGPGDNAGDFAVQLVEGGRVPPEVLAELLVCPGAALADEIRSGSFVMRVYDRNQLNAMPPRERAVVRKFMSPFLAYVFPYQTGGGLRYIKDERLPLPILADTAGPATNGFMSSNHGNTVVQVLLQDGSVRSLRSVTMPGFRDVFFINERGQMKAGLRREDIVLGNSDATPMLETVSQSR